MQAWDANTAIVMASGPGDKSRLYKTTDGCKTWKLIFTNPDEDGFFDAIQRTIEDKLYVLATRLNASSPCSKAKIKVKPGMQQANSDEMRKPMKHPFAASNSELAAYGPYLLFGVEAACARILTATQMLPAARKSQRSRDYQLCCRVPLVRGACSCRFAGLGSVLTRCTKISAKNGMLTATVVAVGGTYDHPETRHGQPPSAPTAAKPGYPSTTPPHGYRSTVQYSQSEKLWITAGTNGSDICRDDGRTWQPLDNGNWNALSLPFIVGPNGRIARLNPAALPKP